MAETTTYEYLVSRGTFSALQMGVFPLNHVHVCVPFNSVSLYIGDIWHFIAWIPAGLMASVTGVQRCHERELN
jgi:hypothetical protein